MHSKSRHIARAKKRTRKACAANQNPKKVRRELFFLARRPSERVSAFARVSFLLRSLLLVNGFFSLLKPLDVTFARSLRRRPGRYIPMPPSRRRMVVLDPTPRIGVGRALRSSRVERTRSGLESIETEKDAYFFLLFFLGMCTEFEFSRLRLLLLLLRRRLPAQTCRRRRKTARRKQRQRQQQEEQQCGQTTTKLMTRCCCGES